jgi:hypothetical protein
MTDLTMFSVSPCLGTGSSIYIKYLKCFLFLILLYSDIKLLLLNYEYISIIYLIIWSIVAKCKQLFSMQY